MRAWNKRFNWPFQTENAVRRLMKLRSVWTATGRRRQKDYILRQK